MATTCDVFLSYAREDRTLARSVVESLGQQRWSVFWDHDVAPGAMWSDVLEQKLRGARCVLAIWTDHSIKSDYVKDEASFARYERKLVQAVVEGCEIPKPYRAPQAVTLQLVEGAPSKASVDALLGAANAQIGPKGPLRSVPAPQPFEAVTADHLTLVHSSWRKPEKDPAFGNVRMHQIHVILFGAPAALDRVEHVTYHLDAAYRDKQTYVQEDRNKNFGFYELANGYSTIVALVKVRGQGELVELSRFVNLAETGPHLSELFDKH